MDSRYGRTPSGLIVPEQAIPVPAWVKDFTVGEMIPVKGHWFTVGHIAYADGTDHQGIALFYSGPASRRAKNLEVKMRAEEKGMTALPGGKKEKL